MINRPMYALRRRTLVVAVLALIVLASVGAGYAAQDSSTARPGAPQAKPALKPAPTISSLQPSKGHWGKSVTIAGTGFKGTLTVKFNGTSASFHVVSKTQITTSVPHGATTGPVTVTTSHGTGTSPTEFTVVN
jgi:IPT/TIG domain-containing protein